MNLLKRLLRKLLYNTAEKNTEWYKKNSDIKIGLNCKVFPSVSIGSEPYLIEIGDDVELTDGVRLLTHDGGIKVAMNLGMCQNADLFGKIVIGNNVFVGVNSIILPNVSIGNNVIVGAGSVVTKNVPDNVVVCGTPAHVISSIEEYYYKNVENVFETDNLNYHDKKMIVLKSYLHR